MTDQSVPLDGHPAFAPDQMPEFVKVPAGEPAAWEVRWAAAQTANGIFAIVIEDSFDEKTGKALTVAMCPSDEYAQYIAYFHNMLLLGSQMLEGCSVDDILKGYATHTRPTPTKSAKSATPETTGGYL